MLTGAQVADCEAAKQLLERLPAARVLHGDKGYDTDLIRRRVDKPINNKADPESKYAPRLWARPIVRLCI